jgi:hypothetical protein
MTNSENVQFCLVFYKRFWLFLQIKTQRRNAALRAAFLLWCMKEAKAGLCPATLHNNKTLKPKKLWRTLRVRQSFLGSGFYKSAKRFKRQIKKSCAAKQHNSFLFVS